MNEELKAELEALSKNLQGKTSEEVKKAISEFEKKSEEAIEAKVKSLVGEEVKTIKEQLEKESSDAIEAVKNDLESQVNTVNEYAEKLDLKLQDKKSEEKDKVSFDTEVKSLVKDNFSQIKEVRKGNGVKIDFKVVGDMTLANLTGDQPRVYSNDVAMVPAQLANFVDLLGPSIVIDGGTYTFPRETGSEGSIATQTEGALKSQIDYDLTMVDVNTDFLAGFSVYSKKMRNNLPFLESFLPRALRRDYFIAENSLFNQTLSGLATASTEVITGQNQIEMILNEVAKLEGLNHNVNGIALRPADWYAIATTEKSTGAGYGLPGIVNYSNGVLTVNGIPVYKVNWLATNKYYVGDWTTVNKVVTEGLTLTFSDEDTDNFRKNNITAKIEAQIALAVERPDAIIYGDFTAT